MKKNVAGQTWKVFAFNRTTNAPLSGDAANITAKIKIDSAAAIAVNDTNPTEIEDGYYQFELTQAETNGDELLLLPESVTTNIQIIAIPPAICPIIPAYGAGAVTWTYTLTDVDTGDPIDGAEIWMSTDSAGSNIIASGTTNDSGIVIFYLDSGTVYVWRSKAGWNFDNPDQETVS